ELQRPAKPLLLPGPVPAPLPRRQLHLLPLRPAQFLLFPARLISQRRELHPLPFLLMPRLTVETRLQHVPRRRAFLLRILQSHLRLRARQRSPRARLLLRLFLPLPSCPRERLPKFDPSDRESVELFLPTPRRLLPHFHADQISQPHFSRAAVFARVPSRPSRLLAGTCLKRCLLRGRRRRYGQPLRPTDC